MEKYIERIIEQDLAVADLELEARPGEGFEIRHIGVRSGAALSAIKIFIGDELMAGMPVANGKEEVLPETFYKSQDWVLLETLRRRFPDVPPFRVSEGEKLLISNDGAVGIVEVFYKHLVGDQIPAKEDPGGSNSVVRLFVSHGTAAWNMALSSTETHLFDTSLNPIPLKGFPFVGSVPGKTKLELLGFCTREGDLSHADVTYDGVRMWKKNEALLSPNEAFVPPEYFQYLTDTNFRQLYMFPKAIIFESNETLKIEVQATNVNVAAQDAEMFLTAIFLQRGE